MTRETPTPTLLEARGVDTARALEVLQSALAGADDGELFLERSESEGWCSTMGG
jgi:TldD protein